MEIGIAAACLLGMVAVYIMGLVSKRDEVARVREASLLEGFQKGVLATAKVQKLPITPAMRVYRDLQHVSLNL